MVVSINTRSRSLDNAELLLCRLLERFPEWVDPDRKPEPGPGGEMWVEYPVPHHPGHLLRFLVWTTDVQVDYDDGDPPGAAEMCFFFETSDDDENIETVVEFIEEIVSEHKLIVREHLPRFWRWVRRHDYDSLLRFKDKSDPVLRKRRRLKCIYSWRGTYDWCDEVASGVAATRIE